MSGIAGQIDRNGGSLRQIGSIYEEMGKTLAPDGAGRHSIYLTDEAALIQAGEANGMVQPLRFSRGQEEYILVCDGELYNAENLRQALIDRGHTFASRAHAEILARAYLEWGEAAINRLNGVFALAVYETAAKRLFVARDRCGVRPFFYAQADGAFLFASQIKTLLVHPLCPPEINENGLAEIFLIGPGRTPGCGVFRGIKELRPGWCGVYEKGRFIPRQYWRLTDKPHTDSLEETTEKVRFLVDDAVKRQLSGSGPLCAFLSGGLDSSIISAVAARQLAAKGEQLNTFSVDYEDNARYFTPGKFQNSTDTEYIKAMTDHLGTVHHRIVLKTDDLVNALFPAVDARDLPGMADVDASLLLFAKAVREHAGVALSGECADEIFGGYPWYRDKELRARYGFPWSRSTKFRAGFLTPDLRASINPQEYVDRRYEETLADVSLLPGQREEERQIKQMTHLNFNWFMQTLIDRTDRMGRHAGLKVRVPLCDHRIADYLYAVPFAFKDAGGFEKGLLRRAAAKLLPEKVLWRKKNPYPKTHHPAYLAAVSARLGAVLADSAAPLLQIVDRTALEKLLESTSQTPWYGQLMTTPQTIAYFLQMNYWLEKYKIRIL